jgi:hypothetical protein
MNTTPIKGIVTLNIPTKTSSHTKTSKRNTIKGIVTLKKPTSTTDNIGYEADYEKDTPTKTTTKRSISNLYDRDTAINLIKVQHLCNNQKKFKNNLIFKKKYSGDNNLYKIGRFKKCKYFGHRYGLNFTWNTNNIKENYLPNDNLYYMNGGKTKKSKKYKKKQ